MKGTSRSAPFEVTLTFEPEADGTRVGVESAFQAQGVMKLVAPMFMRGYERGWMRGLANLKRMMEAGEL